MGRLFWKLFVIFWLAQILTSLGTGLALWSWHIEQEWVARLYATDPPPQTIDTELDLEDIYQFFPPPLPLFVGGMVSLLMAALLAWHFTRPIRSLREAFHAMANGKLDTRADPVVKGRKDEIADLGNAFDLMANRLQNLLESKSQLLHNISHELRSPLARMQVAIDLLHQRPERSEDFTSRLQRDMQRIDSLVGELLMMERLDSTMMGYREERVDLQLLMQQIVEDAGFEATPKQCKVTLDCKEPSYVNGQRELLFRAFENVIRNAIRHVPVKGIVEISIHSAPNGVCTITIADSGKGISPADLEQIFLPFFQGKYSRQNEHKGFGLGLAITYRIIREHGGTIIARNRDEGGLLITVTLPAAI